MVEEKGGWFVVNIKDARWFASPSFGRRCNFQMEGRFPETGINLAVVEPGQPVCRYHRENAQENFLVISGECRLIANGEERDLKTWDFVHCPAGVTHVFVGAGSKPCAILMIGHRPETQELLYPKHPAAAKHEAEAPEETSDPKVAYADIPKWERAELPAWPV